MRPSSLDTVRTRAREQGATLTRAEEASLRRADLNRDGTIGNSAAERRAAWRAVDSFDHDGSRNSASARRGRGELLARSLAPDLPSPSDAAAARGATGPSVTVGAPTVTVSGVPDISRERVVPRGGRWNSAAILDRLGQYDNTTAPATQSNRCGAAVSLAGAVLGGRASTARYADRLATATDGPDSSAARAIAGRVRRGTATFGDMHRLQDISYRMANRDDNSSLSVGEMRDVARSTGGRELRPTGASAEETRARISQLRPGRSFMMLISRTPGDPPGRSGHYVRAGRDSAGREFIYDPARRDHHLVYRDTDPAAFSRYTDSRPISSELRYRGTDAAQAAAERAGLMDADPNDPAVRERLRSMGVEVVERGVNRILE